MALNGPLNIGDLSISGITHSLRFGGRGVTKTTAFTIETKEAQVYDVTGTASLICTLPSAISTDLRVGDQFFIMNNSTGTLSIRPNTTSTILDILEPGECALIILRGTATGNGTWGIFVINPNTSQATKYVETFNALVKPDTNASWEAAVDGAHVLNINASSLVSGNPLIEVLDGDNKVVLIEKEINTTADIKLIVPVLTGVTSVFSGKVIVF